MKKTLITIISVVVILGLAFGVYYFMKNKGPQYLGTVATEQITKDEFVFFGKYNKSQIEDKNQLTDDAKKATYWKDKKNVDELKEMTLKQILDVKIQLAKARENNVTALNDDSKKKLENMKTQELSKYKDNKAEADKSIFKDYGIKFDQYVAIYQELLLRQQFQDTYKVPDSEIQKYYDTNKSNYDMATVRHILFTSADTDPKEKQDAAKKKAEDTLAKAKAGQDFAELAKTLSEDPGSKENGGAYEFPKGQMMKEFENWAFDSSRKKGDMGIIKTTYGYHVMQFEKRATKPVNDVKDTIRFELYNKELEKWKDDPKYKFNKNDAAYNSVDLIG